jgi:hypothetical protein
VQDTIDRAGEHAYEDSGFVLEMRRHVTLVGEVERGLEQGERFDETLAPALNQRPESALELTQRLPALRFRLGVDEIGEAFDAAQVHAPVQEGAARELTGLRCATARECGESADDGGAGRETAMNVELGLVLARKAMRSRHPRDQRLVEDLVRGRSPQMAQGQPPRRRQSAPERLEQPARARAADADDRDRGPAVAARGGEYRIVGSAHGVSPRACLETRKLFHVKTPGRPNHAASRGST